MKTTRRIASIILAIVIVCSMAITSFATLSVNPTGSIREDNITYVNREFTLRAKADGDVTYKSSDENLATVSENGVVNTLRAGECTVTVTNEATNETVDYIFTIRNGGLTGMSYTTIYYGRSQSINRSKREDLTFESSDTKIATVDENGNVKSTGIGTCFITATDPVTGAQDVCEVHVEFLWWEFFSNIIYFVKNLIG